MSMTVIRAADWVVAWNPDRGHHEYLRDADVVFADGRIGQVGGRWEGSAAREIDGRGLMVMPGLVNIHCHPRSQPIYKGFIEELGSHRFYGSGLYDVKAVLRGDAEAAPAAAALAYGELLCSGTTTVVDLCTPYSGWVDLVARSGLRAFLGPAIAAATWHTEDGHQLQYRWAEDGGDRSFGVAREVMEEAERHASGRLGAILAPDTLDTCTPELIGRAIELADRTGRHLTVHCAESIVEFNEFTRRQGVTPVRWAEGQGLLRPGVILGHAVFLDHHSWLHWRPSQDLDRLAKSGAAVAHCPTPFARYGQTMEHLGRYVRAGIPVGLGTDSFPHNLIEEMRVAAMLGRIAAEDHAAITTDEVFHAATVVGADALGRPDLGRIVPGAHADLVLVDLGHPIMRPLRDPLRSLIYSAADRAVRDVFVDGRQVVENGRPLGIDMAEAAERLEAAQRRAEALVPSKDYKGRNGEAISPLTLPRSDATRR